MKATKLSPEFYVNLYKRICEADIDADMSDDTCSVHLELDDVDGYDVSLEATFEVKVIDDSFDHAFGTEHAWHCEFGELTDIDDVYLYDKDENDMSHLFDHDAFLEQFKRYEVKFHSGIVVKSGDTVIVITGGKHGEAEFLYKDTLSGDYICKPIGNQFYKFPRSYSWMFPNTETNRKLLANR